MAWQQHSKHHESKIWHAVCHSAPWPPEGMKAFSSRRDRWAPCRQGRRPAAAGRSRIRAARGSCWKRTTGTVRLPIALLDSERPASSRPSTPRAMRNLSSPERAAARCNLLAIQIHAPIGDRRRSRRPPRRRQQVRALRRGRLGAAALPGPSCGKPREKKGKWDGEGRPETPL